MQNAPMLVSVRGVTAEDNSRQETRGKIHGYIGGGMLFFPSVKATFNFWPRTERGEKTGLNPSYPNVWRFIAGVSKL
jgi:hypothetical protein